MVGDSRSDASSSANDALVMLERCDQKDTGHETGFVRGCSSSSELVGETH